MKRYTVKVKSLRGNSIVDWHPYTRWLEERDIQYFDYVDRNDDYNDTWSFDFNNEEDAAMFRLAWG